MFAVIVVVVILLLASDNHVHAAVKQAASLESSQK
jgi:hypothetical protein